MDGPGDEILPYPAFPTDQDRRIRVGDVLDDRPDGAHRRASVENREMVDEITLSNVLLRHRPVRVKPFKVHEPLLREGSQGGRTPGVDAARTNAESRSHSDRPPESATAYGEVQASGGPRTSTPTTANAMSRRVIRSVTLPESSEPRKRCRARRRSAPAAPQGRERLEHPF